MGVTLKRAMLFRRRVTDSADSGSMFLAMLLVLIGSALAALMVPVVLTQINSTSSDLRRVHALNAAQAGIDTALGQIRNANDGTDSASTGVPNGQLSKLPCGPFTANVTTPSATTTKPSSYQVSVAYYASDPRGQSAQWLSANAIQCIATFGVKSTPAFALLQSTGADAPVGSLGSALTRSLQATYIFKTTNQNIVGGLIHNTKGSSPDLCLDAGSPTPTAGTIVTMQSCVAGNGRQLFAYNKNLTLVLVASKTPSLPLGMCLDAGWPEANGAVVSFQPCATVTQFQQQWSFNDSANFEGTLDGTLVNGPCFTITAVVGSQVKLGGCTSDGTSVFSPDAAVGAGAAGASSGQLVNFNQFGRCLDVTQQVVSSPFLIDWPCKQSPDPAGLKWNQVWTLPAIGANQSSATGLVFTTYNGTRYCLSSPQSTAFGAYVVLVASSACTNGTASGGLQWTVFGNTGAYGTSYTIQDVSSTTTSITTKRCLAPTDPNTPSPDLYNGTSTASKIVVSNCDGSTLQKWNAPPDIQSPTPLKDIGEK